MRSREVYLVPMGVSGNKVNGKESKLQSFPCSLLDPRKGPERLRVRASALTPSSYTDLHSGGLIHETKEVVICRIWKLHGGSILP